MLFTERSLWTMVHGIGLGGGALLGLGAALFFLYAARSSSLTSPPPPNASRAVAGLTVLTALTLWLTVLVGTFIVFPPYRAMPPSGAADLSQFPRSALMADPDTAWLHAFAMETKEHAPWIAAMLATAVAFVAVRYGSKLLTDASLRNTAIMLLAICFALVSYVSLLGVFVNKVAPLQ